MQRVGTMGTTMMRRTCTVQVNLDFGSEPTMDQEAARGAGAGQTLSPPRSSPNSPFLRRLRRTATSVARPRLARPRPGAHRHVALRLRRRGSVRGMGAVCPRCADVFSSTATGAYIDAPTLANPSAISSRASCPALWPGERPTLSDWADHLTTLFPEARIKKYIEMRGADGGPWRRLCALPAFWVGLMYDDTALDAAWDLVKGWDAETRDALRVEASVTALQGQVGPISMHDLAREVLAISEAGLKVTGTPRCRWPDPGRDAFPERAEGQRPRPAWCPLMSCWPITTVTGAAT